MNEIKIRMSETSEKLFARFLARTHHWYTAKVRSRFDCNRAIRETYPHEMVTELHSRKIAVQRELIQRIIDLEQEVIELRRSLTKEEHEHRS